LEQCRKTKKDREVHRISPEAEATTGGIANKVHAKADVRNPCSGIDRGPCRLATQGKVRIRIKPSQNTG
ncbi:MAG: hypothetical protein ACK5TJ_01310, partial [Brevundimonas sp.]